MVSAWYEVFGRTGLERSGHEMQALADAGISLRWREDNTAGLGVLLFDESGEGLYQHVRDVSRQGEARVLAIARAPTAVPEGASWRLLQAGAAEPRFDLAPGVTIFNRRGEPIKLIVDTDAKWEMGVLLHGQLVSDRLQAWQKF